MVSLQISSELKHSGVEKYLTWMLSEMFFLAKVKIMISVVLTVFDKSALRML